jgi:hypothetical protein
MGRGQALMSHPPAPAAERGHQRRMIQDRKPAEDAVSRPKPAELQGPE